MALEVFKSSQHLGVAAKSDLKVDFRLDLPKLQASTLHATHKASGLSWQPSDALQVSSVCVISFPVSCLAQTSILLAPLHATDNRSGTFHLYCRPPRSE
jgi:hypothetical protein